MSAAALAIRNVFCLPFGVFLKVTPFMGGQFFLGVCYKIRLYLHSTYMLPTNKLVLYDAEQNCQFR